MGLFTNNSFCDKNSFLFCFMSQHCSFYHISDRIYILYTGAQVIVHLYLTSPRNFYTDLIQVQSISKWLSSDRDKTVISIKLNRLPLAIFCCNLNITTFYLYLGYFMT